MVVIRLAGLAALAGLLIRKPSPGLAWVFRRWLPVGSKKIPVLPRENRMPLLAVEALPVSQPITIECVAEVSRRYQIPVALLGGVLAQERGRLGQSSPNKNGTWDYGPMQVNSAWLKFFAPYGVTEHRLRHDGCANLAVGAWIIRYEQGRAKGDLWQAVGRYHSHKPDLAAAYQYKVSAKVGELSTGKQTLARLLEEANGGG